MKTFKLLGMTLLMVLCATTFTACIDDDENDKPMIEEANLIGKRFTKWRMVKK